jgi:nucleoside-diphosphate-sugar epimerase
MKVLIIGGAGYIGSVLIEELLERGYAVKVFDRLYYGEVGLKDFREKIELVVGDMRQLNPSVLEGVDAVINVGGLSNDPTAEYNPKANFEMNTLATELSAKQCKKVGIRRYIFSSSCSIYDFGVTEQDRDVLVDEQMKVDPKAAYSSSKDFCPVILRNGTVFGFSPRMRYDLVVNTFVKDALARGTITVFYGGEMWRPLVAVRDVARAFIACLEAEEEKIKGQVFNLVYRNFRISELALRTKETLAKLGINPQINTDYRYRGVRNYRVSGDKINNALGVRPLISVEESVREMVEKIKEHSYTDFDNPRYYNINWMKLLEEADRIIKVTGSVF